MLRNLIVATTASVALLLCNASAAGWFGPSNYSECVIDGMKGVSSDVAARAVSNACAAKFPAKKPELPAKNPVQPRESKLPGSALLKIQADTPYRYPSPAIGNGGENEIALYAFRRSRDGGQRFQLYNGNDDWRVSKIRVRITDEDTNASREYWMDGAKRGRGDSLPYGTAATVPPLGEEYFIFPHDLPENWSWTIVEALGWKE